ncbi:MAG TPA: hypothetical protein VII63_07310 [Caulobacteraceae bacterium]
MANLKTLLKTGALGVIVAGGVLASTAASADIACNRWHECWRVKERYTNYPPAARVVFYGDEWRATHARGYRWRRDRDDDHGYYQNGRWIAFAR